MDSTDCAVCYDVAHDEMDERETCDEHAQVEELPTGNGIVQIAYLHGDRVSHSWHDSMRRVVDYDDKHSIIAPKPLNVRCGSGVLITPMRNYTTKLFLDGTEHEWLLMTDTDMGFESDAVHKLLVSADPIERPVIGGLCFAVMTAGYDNAGGWRQSIVPTMYKIGEVTGQPGKISFCYYGPYERDAVLPVAATGAAFLLMHRSVLNLMRERFGDTWWSQMTDHAGDTLGEDIAFCMKARACGVPIFVNTGVRTTHHKETWVSEEDYLAVAGLLASDLDEDIQPRPVYLKALPPHIDVAESLRTLSRGEHVREDGMLKLQTDLDRYDQIIKATLPNVIIETGTHRGASARWFADRVDSVITIDKAIGYDPCDDGSIWYVNGDSTDPKVVEHIRRAVSANQRVMVVLDSDHSAMHVAREIDLYGPLVTPGCYLVVEDGIFGYAPDALREQHIPSQQGSPLDAMSSRLVSNPDWSRDVAIERTSTTSHHPAGWWVRNG